MTTIESAGYTYKIGERFIECKRIKPVDNRPVLRKGQIIKAKAKVFTEWTTFVAGKDGVELYASPDKDSRWNKGKALKHMFREEFDESTDVIFLGWTHRRIGSGHEDNSFDPAAYLYIDKDFTVAECAYADGVQYRKSFTVLPEDIEE